jgi:uncharacterized protein YecE (DUF72 family)
MGKVRIGISGWRYGGWRGVFYPEGLAQRRELEYASRSFPTIEINGTFYSLQRPEHFARWYDATPPGFVFAVKGSRFISHMKRLKDVEKPLANFLASGLFNLREKTGPFLWQFPPDFRFDAGRLEEFFAMLPRDMESALRLARRRDARVKGRCRLAIDGNRELRHAIEIRHESFLDPAFVSLLRRQNVALVVADTAGKWPFVEDVTADFVYVRLHGDKVLYASGYSDRALDLWAERIRAWSTGGERPGAKKIDGRGPQKRATRDVYCYFDNDAKVKAPFDAARLMERLGRDDARPRRRGPPSARPRGKEYPRREQTPARPCSPPCCQPTEKNP